MFRTQHWPPSVHLYLNMPYQWGDTIWDVPNAMCAAAFTGIALFLSLELIVRMAFSWTRHSELYFWSCFVSSWAILLHTITILLFDYGSWQNYSAVVLIHITWCTFVVLQSVVLLSRLSLITKSETTKRWIRYMIVFTGVGFGATTVIFGIVAVSNAELDFSRRGPADHCSDILTISIMKDCRGRISFGIELKS